MSRDGRAAPWRTVLANVPEADEVAGSPDPSDEPARERARRAVLDGLDDGDGVARFMLGLQRAVATDSTAERLDELLEEDALRRDAVAGHGSASREAPDRVGGHDAAPDRRSPTDRWPRARKAPTWTFVVGFLASAGGTALVFRVRRGRGWIIDDLELAAMLGGMLSLAAALWFVLAEPRMFRPAALRANRGLSIALAVVSLIGLVVLVPRWIDEAFFPAVPVVLGVLMFAAAAVLFTVDAVVHRRSGDAASDESMARRHRASDDAMFETLDRLDDELCAAAGRVIGENEAGAGGELLARRRRAGVVEGVRLACRRGILDEEAAIDGLRRGLF
ncbi:hypothetical protein GCM10009750_33250 [Agromyces salentinus]|uniref:Uncharacterized protein n=2 Tax=Agromyces salentinus TaxID=269421 RepID=A0ABN2MYE0_9MICO